MPSIQRREVVTETIDVLKLNSEDGIYKERL